MFKNSPHYHGKLTPLLCFFFALHHGTFSTSFPLYIGHGNFTMHDFFGNVVDVDKKIGYSMAKKNCTLHDNSYCMCHCDFLFWTLNSFGQLFYFLNFSVQNGIVLGQRPSKRPGRHGIRAGRGFISNEDVRAERSLIVFFSFSETKDHS